MMMDDGSQKSMKEAGEKNKVVREPLGTIGGQRVALLKFDRSNITMFFIEHRTFKTRFESLPNHPTNIFRPVENRDIKKKIKNVMHDY